MKPTFATDQNRRSRDLSPTAQLMLELRDTVFDEWERRVRASIGKAKALSRPVLIDSLPCFYDNIAQTLTEQYSRVTATESTTLATTHGSIRARLTNFEPEILIKEYQLFRSTIFDVLNKHGVRLNHQEITAIHMSIDSGIRESVSAFSMTHTALREQFIAALTNDLREPLRSAITAQDLILTETDPNQTRPLALTTIENLKHMEDMISGLLDLMSVENGDPMQLEVTQCDLSEVVKEVQADTLATHPAVRLQSFGVPIKGWWDRQIIKRVVENLVSNALKHGDQGKLIRITFMETYERVALMVHNEGKPIPPEEQEDIFQPFRWTQATRESAPKGCGVGLPFVRSAVESHGGSITVDSTVERGTTFTVDIPLDARPHQDHAAMNKK